ncbi:hypothetical protein F5878DRAFT_510803, partial [Lentinula raphanica]
SQKFKRRQSIATLEQGECRDKGDVEGEHIWRFILYAVTSLQVDGMSDEEDGEESGQAVKLVLEVGFRREEFRTLFRSIDIRPGVSRSQGGRRFKKRIEISKKAERQPPRGIPSPFLTPRFREGHSKPSQDL